MNGLLDGDRVDKMRNSEWKKGGGGGGARLSQPVNDERIRWGWLIVDLMASKHQDEDDKSHTDLTDTDEELNYCVVMTSCS